MLEEIPEQHKSVFVWGVAELLRRMEEDEEGVLIGFCFLLQALLRRPSRGGKAGRGQVARRFNTGPRRLGRFGRDVGEEQGQTEEGEGGGGAQRYE